MRFNVIIKGKIIIKIDLENKARWHAASHEKSKLLSNKFSKFQFFFIADFSLRTKGVLFLVET